MQDWPPKGPCIYKLLYLHEYKFLSINFYLSIYIGYNTIFTEKDKRNITSY